MDAPGDSNMEIIDQALSEKAAHSTVITSTLLSSAWQGSSAPYHQTIQISGVTAQSNGIITVAPSATQEQREAARNAMLYILTQMAESLAIVADGDKPEIDIPVITILMD